MRAFCLVMLILLTAGTAMADPLVDLNNVFRQDYAAAKLNALRSLGPVVWVEGDDVILDAHGKRDTVHIKPPMYHVLKAMAHIPLALYVIFNQPAAQRPSVDEYTQALAKVGPVLRNQGFSPGQLARQQQILGQSLAFLQQPAELDRFARTVAPLLLQNTADAAHLELDALHHAMRGWKHQLTDEEWHKLHVIVMGPHMPRTGEIAFQYFSRVLAVPEGPRLIYAESLKTEPEALDLLATHAVDYGVGEAFFGAGERLHRDLLSDAAHDYLDVMDLSW